MTVDITNVGLPSSGGGIIIDVHDTSVAITSNTTTKSNFNIPIPGTYSVGDLFVCFIGTLAQTIVSIPSGWDYIDGDDPVEDTDHANSLHLYTLVKTATNSESGTQNVVFSGATPMQAVTLSIENPLDVGNQPDDTVHDFLGVSADNFQMSDISTTQDSELILTANAARFIGGAAPSNIDPEQQALDDGMVVDYQGFADRTSSVQTSIALSVAHMYMPTDGTMASYNWTVTGGLFVRFVGRSAALFQGLSGDTPGENVTATIRLRETTA
jgi:hypothetical protein